MSNRKRTTTLRLQCRRDNEQWHTIRTLSAATSAERRAATSTLEGQKVAWIYSGQFDGHVWRIA
jgi:hypothetical protein